MRLSQLADYFEQLESLTSRDVMVGVLADLFAASESSEEMQKLVYLCEGRLRPAYESVELGINEQLAAQAIVEATGNEVRKIKELYKAIGDYGSVVERLITWSGEGLTVTEAYEALLDLASITGKGSIDAKVSGLARLIKKLSPKEARYLLRVALGRLRLGIGDPTIMTGLAVAYGNSESLRSQIENAYNLCGDLGMVAYVLHVEGPEALSRFHVRVGKPVRVQLAERAASAEEIVARLRKCAVEPKYDGMRTQVHKQGNNVYIFTRNLENITAMFPDVVEATNRQIKAREAIIEGEAISYDPETEEFHPFQVTVKRKRKHMVEEAERELPLKLMVFDCLYVNSAETLYEPYEERRKRLQEITLPDETIEITQAVITDDAQEIQTFFDAMITAGLEGIIAKALDRPYMAGRRTFDWLKLKRSYQGKLEDTIDCVIVGYFTGKGKRAQWGIGSLLCAVYNEKADRFETVSKVASGLTDEEWQHLKKRLDELRLPEKPVRVDSLYDPDVWVQPRYVIEVLADEITHSP
ncbi:MAG: ATP-dependent DNA ligase, partial [Armatimonadetes bacterium]|nr:ATP-dependent DNA ligase [Armatimonadota bacterium]